MSLATDGHDDYDGVGKDDREQEEDRLENGPRQGWARIRGYSILMNTRVEYTSWLRQTHGEPLSQASTTQQMIEIMEKVLRLSTRKTYLTTV